MLVVCAECRRHVRSGDDACPFCGGPAGAAPGGPRRTASGRLTRAAAVGIAAVAVGCNTAADPRGWFTDKSASPPAPMPTVVAVPAYGAPPPPIPTVAPPDAGAPDAADAGRRRHVTVYGGPPPPRHHKLPKDRPPDL